MISVWLSFERWRDFAAFEPGSQDLVGILPAGTSGRVEELGAGFEHGFVLFEGHANLT